MHADSFVGGLVLGVLSFIVIIALFGESGVHYKERAVVTGIGAYCGLKYSEDPKRLRCENVIKDLIDIAQARERK